MEMGRKGLLHRAEDGDGIGKNCKSHALQLHTSAEQQIRPFDRLDPADYGTHSMRRTKAPLAQRLAPAF